MILVTGATGAIGGRVAALLQARGETIRLMSRDPSELEGFEGAEKVAGDYEDPETLKAPMEGVETALLISGFAKPGDRAKLHGNVIDAAARAGVKRLAYLSFQGASPDSKFPFSRDHWLSEQHLKGAGIGYSICRDCLYLDLLPSMFNEEGVVRGPAGDGRTAWVAREDVSQAVAAVLTDHAHAGKTYDLTGPEALSLHEVAQRLSVLTGRSLRYEEETEEAGRAWRSAPDVPDWRVEAWLGSYLAIKAGELSRVDPAGPTLMGRPALGLEAYFQAFPAMLNPPKA